MRQLASYFMPQRIYSKRERSKHPAQVTLYLENNINILKCRYLPAVKWIDIEMSQKNAAFKTDTESLCAIEQKSKHNLSINNKQLLVKYF